MRGKVPNYTDFSDGQLDQANMSEGTPWVLLSSVQCESKEWLTAAQYIS